MGLATRSFAQIITFSRATGATWFNSAGVLVGVDFSTTSMTIGTGPQTLTLTATLGLNRSWANGDSILIADTAAPSTNNMTGTVTSYAASTQVLVVDITSVNGAGTIASWRVSNLMRRLDYNPATLAARGLLIEEQRQNINLYSQDFGATGWTTNNVANVTITAAAATSPDGTTNAGSLACASTATAQRRVYTAANITITASTTYTTSFYVKSNTWRWINLAFTS